MFYNQLEKICKQNNTTPTAFITGKLGLSSSKITAWKNGSIPKYGILKEIANYFRIPISYLFQEEEEENQNEEIRLINAYRSLTDEGKKAVLMFAEVSAQNPQYQKYTDIPKEA